MITLDATDATLRHGLDRVFPRGNHLDYEAAHQFADWLQEQGDWRCHLLAHVTFARSGPGSYTLCDKRGWLGTVPSGQLPTSVSFPGGQCRFACAGTNAHRPADAPAGSIALNMLTDECGGLWSWLTPEQYDAMRADAATAGVAFPERP